MKIKLEFGNHGWGSFIYYNEETEEEMFHGAISYLNDTPMELLDAMEQYMKNGTPLIVEMEEEGSNWTLLVTSYTIFVIIEREKPELIEIETSIESFFKSLLDGIKANWNEVIYWDIMAFNEEELKQEAEVREKELKEKYENCMNLWREKYD